MKTFSILLLSGLLMSVSVDAQSLAVVVMPAKFAGQKAIVELKLKNNLTDKVESARAVCFLIDEQGKMVGHATKWVIGQNHASLEPKGEATFNFVITSPQPFTSTNLIAKLKFSRLVLNGGKLADPTKSVSVTTP